MQRTPEVAIVGAGMSGLCVAIRLLEAGVDHVVIYEGADDLGGTWRDNTYPGLACDVPSRTYQYSFALTSTWSRFFSPGAEIHRYLGEVADRFGVRDRIRFGTRVEAAEYRDGRWRLRTSRGEESSVDFLISATGGLRIPRSPSIAGLETFGGATFHSARWDHDVPLRGRRVAVVGTGSTGAQIVTALAGVAERVVLLQRTAQWVMPLPDRPYRRPTRLAHRLIPGLRELSYYGYRACFDEFSKALINPGWRRDLISAACRAHLLTIRDPALRRQMTPDYQPMCKRLIISGGFYRAVQRDDVAVVTDAIERIEPRGVVTADGALHEVDVIVLATGFDAHAFLRPMRLTGVDGVTLDEAWRDGPRAFDTVSLPDFPNFFMMMGPHSPVGNYALTAVAEVQAEHVVQWITRWGRGEFDAVMPTRRATDDFNREMREALPNTVWASGCDSWYLGADGLPALWPWRPSDHRRRLAHPRSDDYALSGAAASRSPR